MNPKDEAQEIKVKIINRNLEKSFRLSPRSRSSYELGSWGLKDDFGIEVLCSSVCSASLVMWDNEFKNANISVPIVGCSK